VVLGATVYPNWPLPVPEAPNEMVIHGLVELAPRSQLEALAVTLTVPVLPTAGTETLGGDSVRLHAADCTTVNVWVPTVIEAVRTAGLGLGWTW